MVDMAAAATTAQRLVEANGRTVTIQQRSTTPADANKPWRGPAAAQGATLSAILCFVPLAGGGLGQLFEDVPRELIRSATGGALVASLSVPGADLAAYDTVLDGAQAWKILFAQELRPSSTSILWALGLTR